MKRAIIQLHCCLLFAFCCQAQITFEDTSSILFYPTITSGAPIGVVDMNGDGLDDIVTLDNTSHLYIQYQTGNGTFTGFDGGNLGGSQWSLCVADVDRNGYNDIFTGFFYNGFKLFRSNSICSAYTT